MHSIKRAFFWLSGAGTQTLEQCPAWEQRKYVAFGATVLVPCAFAFIACAYALSTLTDNVRVIYPVAAVWSFIILTIDRALLASYRPYMSIFRKLSQFSLRLVVAILMGITIAHPLVLLLFRDTVSTVIEKDRAAEIEIVRNRFEAAKEKVRGQVTGLEKALAEQRTKWNESFQARFILQENTDASSAIPGLTAAQQTELKAAIEEGTAPVPHAPGRRRKTSRRICAAICPSSKPNWASGRPSSSANSMASARDCAAKARVPARSAPTNSNPAARNPNASAACSNTSPPKNPPSKPRPAKPKAPPSSSLKPNSRKSPKPTKPKPNASPASSNGSKTTRPSHFVAQQNALRETIKHQIDTRLAELSRVQGELAAVATEETEPPRRPARRTPPRHPHPDARPPRRCSKAGNQGGQFAFYTYIVLTMLFMLVDTIPLIVKFFTKPGPYDSLVDRDEITFDVRAPRLPPEPHPLHGPALPRQSHRRHPQPAPRTRARRWRRTHPRRPRVPRFAHRNGKILRRKNEARGTVHRRPAESDKRAAFEAIKKRFYDDLHHRMEIFFTTHHA